MEKQSMALFPLSLLISEEFSESLEGPLPFLLLLDFLL